MSNTATTAAPGDNWPTAKAPTLPTALFDLVSHGMGLSRGQRLNPLPTCQNEGCQRHFYAHNQTLIIVKAGLPWSIFDLEMAFGTGI